MIRMMSVKMAASGTLKVHSFIKAKKKLAQTVRIKFFRTLDINQKLAGSGRIYSINKNGRLLVSTVRTVAF